MARARELDDYQKEHGDVIGPLHGVPVTLKDQFNVKGYDSTLGYVGRAFNPATEDAVLVALLKKLGAVVLAKTNLPQSIMVSPDSLLALRDSWYLTMNYSGVRLRIRFGALPRILSVRTTLPAVRQVARQRY